MTTSDTLDACKGIEGWNIIASFAVGGFEWLGFSKKQPNLMLCISSQKHTVLNCDNGTLQECEIEYDEESLTAICKLVPDEMVSISGQYDGELPLTADQGEKMVIHVPENMIQKITFVSKNGEEAVIHWNYGFYICGFSHDGNYFVLASDAGVTVLKRDK